MPTAFLLTKTFLFFFRINNNYPCSYKNSSHCAYHQLNCGTQLHISVINLFLSFLSTHRNAHMLCHTQRALHFGIYGSNGSKKVCTITQCVLYYSTNKNCYSNEAAGGHIVASVRHVFAVTNNCRGMCTLFTTSCALVNESLVQFPPLWQNLHTVWLQLKRRNANGACSL